MTVLRSVAGAAALVAVGLAAGAALWRTAPPAAAPSAAAPAVDHSAMGHGGAAATAAGPSLAVTLTPEMIARAGIRTTAAQAGTAAVSLRIPGVVQPNRYKQVAVTSLVSGRLMSVRGELGQRVARGQVLATVYSPEFADAQTTYVELHAELAQHDQQLTRTARLAEIGAASRQELEMLAASHARLEAAVETARSRLELLGVSKQRMNALAVDHKVTTEVAVVAPIAGIVSERNANTGLNVDPATPLFTVVDLSNVWVIADLYERDFAAVRLGAPVTVSTPTYPGLAIEGKVSYIDPQMQEATRTAKLRVEAANPGDQLRLGMFVDVSVARGASAAVVLVPRGALQTVGDRRVVYVAAPGPPGHFVERQVEVEDTGGDQVAVVRGLAAGELVVSEGAFFLRAERARAAVE